MIRKIAGALAAATLAVTPVAHGHGTDSHRKKHHQANLDPVHNDFGRTGDPARVVRTVRIHGADDMRYTPASITVQQGDTIRFVVQNKGKVFHEAVLGTMAALKEHAEWMKKHPEMEHDEPFMVHVGPGETGEMIWQFTEVGEFYFGCLVPGHFEAGMVGTIRVVKRQGE